MQDIEKKIDEVLSRGVGEFIDPDGSFRQKLINKNSGKYDDKEIIIKYGVDPTRPDIHLGHAVCLRKLRQFQDLGCKVIFLVGDFTAQIGDPTGKSKARLEIEQQEIEKNVATYLEQIGIVLSLEPTKFDWMRNSDWILSPDDLIPPDDSHIVYEDAEGNKNTFPSNSMPVKSAVWEESRMQKNRLHRTVIHSVSVLRLLSVLRRVTHARLIERDMFKNRIESGEPLFMHEMLYPVFQGIDSNVMAKIYGSCDLEVGGTDQTFNMLMGREMMSVENIPPQSVLAFKLLVGLDGKEKMSKSLDNYIGVTETPNSMFLKVMSLPDTSIISYFELCTELPLNEIAKIAENIVIGENPRKFKILLAKEIIEIYHGKIEAENAAKDYEAMSKGENPENVTPSQGPPAPLAEFILSQGFAKSRSDARRKIEQGGVEIEGKKILDWQYGVSSKDNGKIMKVGKKDYVKIVFKD